MADEPVSEGLLEAAGKVKMLLLDVDGVMTDGGIIMDDDGKEMKVFNVRDGHGIKLLQGAGIKVGIITGRSSGAVKRRAEELQITDLYQNCHDKLAAYEEIKSIHGFKDADFCYIGDDIVDIPLLKRVGLSVATADAVEEVKAVADYITNLDGGKGAVREVAELILKAKGLWEGILDGYHKI